MTGHSYDVSVVGLYILDVLGRPVERIPDRGNVEFIEEIRLTVAGTAGGTVVDLAKLGQKCLAVGAVGQDEKADFVIMEMEKHGIDCSAMQRLDGVPTSATILNVRPNGDRPALHVRGASDHFDVDPSTLSKVLDARFVHLGGTGLLARLDGEPSRKLLAAAKAAGCTTTFDLIATNPETINIVKPLLPHIDYFMPSIEEARDLSGLHDAEDNAKFFLDHGVGCCALTMGGEGSLIATGDTRIKLDAYDIEVVDTTGCGDAYCAGFIAGLSLDYDLEECGHLGAAAASLVASGLGSDAGIVSLSQTLDAMRQWRN
ncbi:MAG: sugar kinase [Rhodobiaceae bacterium]|nr:sugar kinase [Rhodobiaceae bacterium]